MAVTVVRGSRASTVTFALAGLWLVFAASIPFWGESSWMREFVEISCYFIFAMMWYLLAGYGVTTLVCLPVTKGPQGLPVGVQLVGARGSDHLLVSAAQFMETAIAAEGGIK